MRHTRSIGIFILLGILLLLSSVPVRASFDTNSEKHKIDLTILPNYALHTLTLAGTLDEDPSCALAVAQLVPGISTDSISTEDGCSFYVAQIGSIEAVSDTPNTYVATLKPDEFSVSWEKASTTVTLFAADILGIKNTDTSLSTPSNSAVWQIDGSINLLQITIKPWVIESHLTVTSLLTNALRDHLQANVLLSGKIHISNIGNLDSYYQLIGRERNPDSWMIIDDIARVLLDYPFNLSTTTYPGLNFFNDLYAQNGLPRETKLHATVVGHAIKDDSGKLTGEIDLNITGYQITRSIDPPLISRCPSTTSSNINTQERLQNAQHVTLCPWLGPQDSLTLNVPDGLIIGVRSPPNEQNADTLTYRGAGQFEVIIHYHALALNLLKQLLFLIHLFFDSLSKSLIDLSNNELGIALIAAVVFLIFLILSLRLNNLKFLLLVSLTVPTSIILVYLAPSNTALLLLSLIVLAPEVHLTTLGKDSFAWRDFIAITSFIGVIFAINLLAIRGDLEVAGQEQLQALAPVAVLIVLAIMIGAYYPFASDAQERHRIRAMQRDRLPAYATFFLVAATYDVLDQSLLSLIILLASIFLLKLWQEHVERILLAEISPIVVEKPKPDSSLTRVKTRVLKLWRCLFPSKSSPCSSDNPPVVPLEAPPPVVIPDNDDKRWSRHLSQLLGNPGVFILIIVIAFAVISLGTTSLSGIVFTLTTFIGSALLFASLYDFLPGQGFVKAFVFSVPLWLIFVFGIGTSDRGLNLLNDTTTVATAMRYALYFEQLPALLVGRIVFYLTVPLMVSLYVDFKEREVNPPQDKSPITIRSYLTEFSTLWTLAAALISALLPPLYGFITQQPAISTLVDVLGKITKGG